MRVPGPGGSPVPQLPDVPAPPPPSTPAVPAAPPSPAPAFQRVSADPAAAEFARQQAVPAPSTAVSPLGARLATLRGNTELAAKGVTALTRAGDSVTVNSLLTRAPGTPSAPTVRDASVGTTLDPHGFSGALVRRTGESNTTHDFSVARGGINLSTTGTVAGASTNTSAYWEKGFVSVGRSLEWASRDGAHSAGASLGGSLDTLMVGGSVAATGASGVGRGLRALGLATADRSVKDLGPYAGPEPSLQGTRRMELHRVVGPGVALSPGLTLGGLGVGGRFAVDRTKDVVFRSHLEDATARQVLLERHGVAGFLRDKARALDPSRDPVQVPSLAAPEKLKLGDEIIVSTTGSMVAGLAVGGLAARAGVSGLVRGEFELAVRKSSAHEVELVITPTRVKALQFFLDTPVSLEANSTQAWAHALRQSFRFDLREPGALAAYQQALKGELPNGLGQAETHTGKTAASLVRMIQAEPLPVGVARLGLEKLDLDSVSRGGGVSWGMLQDGSYIAGLAFRRTALDQHHVSAAADGALRTDTRGVEKRWEVLLSGVETAGVFASQERLTLVDPEGNVHHQFIGLGLKARFTDGRVRGTELNDEVIDVLNGKLGTALPRFHVPGHNQTREISVERTLTAADLETLAHVNLDAVTTAAAAVDLDAEDVAELVRDLASRSAPEPRSARVQEFIVQHGLGGMGALHRLLGGAPQALHVTTTSSAYDTPAQELQTLAFKYAQPVQGDVEQLKQRFKAVEKALEKADHALQDVADDGLLEPAAREEIARSVRRARQGLAALVDVRGLSPAERARFHRELDAGWTTALEYRLMAHLERAGLE